MDRQVFRNKLIELQENMFNFALILTSNHEDAKDLLQDTTLKVLDSQEKFIDNTNFKGWVLTIMRNIFINNYYKMVRVNTVIDHRADVHNLDVVHNNYCHSPEEEYQFKEMSEAVYDLKGDFQIVFLMYLNGYKYDEIAKELNIPLGTLKSRIFLARQHLQKKFSR